MMSNSPLRERWDALTPAPDRPVFQLCDAEHPLQWYIGCEPSRSRILLLVASERPVPPRAMRFIKVEVHARENAQWALLIHLVDQSMASLFAHLCEDLVENTRHLPEPTRAVSFVMRRLSQWQRLFERGPSGLLSEPEVRGLVAELLVLEQKAIAVFGVDHSASYWVGPLGAEQDFQAPDEAWEVKSIRVGAETVAISSEQQLAFSGGALRLIVVTLGESKRDHDAADASLNALVERLRQQFAVVPSAAEQFEDRLVAAGFIERPEYDEPVFKMCAMDAYEVTGTFPRLTPPDLPAGVCDVRYDVVLQRCAEFRIS